MLHFDDAVKKYPISLEIQLNLYRILQEQLRNILKYANATLIEVDVLIHNNNLKMRISDNGIGFNVDTVKGGIGLANMKRRAELFSGKFEIDSSPGNGCINNRFLEAAFFFGAAFWEVAFFFAAFFGAAFFDCSFLSFSSHLF